MTFNIPIFTKFMLVQFL